MVQSSRSIMDPASEHLNANRNVEDPPPPILFRDLFFITVGIVSYIFDVATDAIVARDILYESQYGFFASSLTVILLTAVVSNLISWKWFKNDDETTKINRLAHIFLMGPLLRSVNVLKYAANSYFTKDGVKKSHYLDKYLKYHADFSLLGVIEAFIEAEPQLILQLALLMPKSPCEIFHLEWSRYVSLAMSMFCLSSAVAKFHVSLRKYQEVKRNISCSGLVCQYFWHLMITVSRVISLCCLVSLFPIWALILSLVHIAVIYIYLLFNGPDHILYDSKVWHHGMIFIMACINMFVGITMREGPTRGFYTFLFFIFFVENSFSIGIWSWKMYECTLFYVLFPASILTFFLGLIFMGLYHKYFHPSLGSQTNAAMPTEL